MVGAVEADRAGLHGGAARLGHEGDDGRAVDAARQEGAERNVGDHARTDGVAQPLDQLLFERGGLGGRRIGEVHVPPADRRRHRPSAPDQQIVAGGKLGHARDDRRVVRDVAEGEEVLDRARIGLAAEARMGKQRLQLRAEDQRTVGERGEVERLHAQAIAGEEKRVLGRVVEGEGEHAVETRQAGRPPLPP
ncbi:MAG: hypothetical protein QOJ94_907 [Sphingomonadales bacterium]|nr:hypothetical protein [Sphingomonadales bacterium]